MTKRIWVLGAASLEMDAIEHRLVSVGEIFVHAQTLEPNETWRRVNDQNAYDRSGVYARLWARPEKTVYLVECNPALVDLKGAALRVLPSSTYDSRIIDYRHRSADPSCDFSPDKFMQSSSIGQVISELARLGRLTQFMRVDRYDSYGPWVQDPSCLGKPGEWILNGFRGMWSVGQDIGHSSLISPVRIPQEVLLITACSYCLRAAYANECPGVYQPDVKAYRAKVRAKERKCSEDRVLADIEATTKKLRDASRISWMIFGPSFADMRGKNCPELIDAGAHGQIAYLTGPVEDASGRKKVICSGRSDDVKSFFGWAKEQKMIDIHGNPAREFGEAYLP